MIGKLAQYPLAAAIVVCESVAMLAVAYALDRRRFR